MSRTVDRSLLPVVTSAQASARDTAAIDAGIPSRALMQRAGAAAAAEIALHYPTQLQAGALVLAGPGNNGGDGWVIARALAAAGARVRVIEPVAARTPDALAERELALPHVLIETLPDGDLPAVWRGEGIIVDALLGTGTSGAPRGAIASVIDAIRTADAKRAMVIAIDLPTGVDATTGEVHNALSADCTLTFGTMKRGHLVARQQCGRIAVLDIGLGVHATLHDGAPSLVDERWVAEHVPAIEAASHKGVRKKLVIVGGAEGMAGATILAARAAMRSGIGMVRLLVAQSSLGAVQEAEPFALAGAWPEDDDSADADIVNWANCVVLGPGLGRSTAARKLLERVLQRWRGPVLLDADALTIFADDVDALHTLLANRVALLTPHPAEFARLAHCSVDDVLARRYDIGPELSRRVGGTVLLKGVPTVISGANRTLVSATGTPALAAAGSGDILSGIAGTLLAQMGDALHAGAAAAWIHGRAAETATVGERSAGGGVRGLTLDDVLVSLGQAWQLQREPTRYPVLLELPAVGER